MQQWRVATIPFNLHDGIKPNCIRTLCSLLIRRHMVTPWQPLFLQAFKRAETPQRKRIRRHTQSVQELEDSWLNWMTLHCLAAITRHSCSIKYTGVQKNMTERIIFQNKSSPFNLRWVIHKVLFVSSESEMFTFVKLSVKQANQSVLFYFTINYKSCRRAAFLC